MLRRLFLEHLMPPNVLKRPDWPPESLLPSQVGVASSSPAPYIFDSLLGNPLPHSTAIIRSAIVDARRVQPSDLSLFLYRSSKTISSLSTKDARILYLTTSESPLQTETTAGLVRSMSKELGPRGTTVNQIAAPSGLSPPTSFFTTDACAFVSSQVLSYAPPPPPPSSKTCVVTGGARGIGLSIALYLKSLNLFDSVVAVDHPSSSFLDAEAAGLKVLNCDVTSPSFPSLLADSVNEPIACLVHAAGITRDRTLKRMSALEWRSVMDVNLASVINCDTALCGAGLLDETARVVAISSTSGIAGNLGQSNYAASKSGLLGWMKEFNLDHPSRSYNAVCPGFIETDMTSGLPLATELGATRFLTPLKAKGRGSDVALAVGEMVSGGWRGQKLRVCGGMMVGR